MISSLKGKDRSIDRSIQTFNLVYTFIQMFYVIYAQHLYPRVSLQWLRKSIADISYNTINGIAQCIKQYMVVQNGTLNRKVHDEIITAVCTLIQNR